MTPLMNGFTDELVKLGGAFDAIRKLKAARGRRQPSYTVNRPMSNREMSAKRDDLLGGRSQKVPAPPRPAAVGTGGLPMGKRQHKPITMSNQSTARRDELVAGRRKPEPAALERAGTAVARGIGRAGTALTHAAGKVPAFKPGKTMPERRGVPPKRVAKGGSRMEFSESEVPRITPRKPKTFGEGEFEGTRVTAKPQPTRPRRAAQAPQKVQLSEPAQAHYSPRKSRGGADELINPYGVSQGAAIAKAPKPAIQGVATAAKSPFATNVGMTPPMAQKVQRGAASAKRPRAAQAPDASMLE